MSKIVYGPDHPHALSTLKTELVCEGKYDEFGNRRAVDVAVMQNIEMIDQPRSEAAATDQLQLFKHTSKRLDDFRNMLIWGDNKVVMASLLKQFKGKFDLIYIDPTFDVGAGDHGFRRTSSKWEGLPCPDSASPCSRER